MFVLVRWEPIVHDDYPWIIPFWVCLIGIPLHLWTDRNLRKIGSRLGLVDKVEHTEGRMLIDVDTRRPLKFSRKAESPEGDEVTLEIKYEMLFKHFSTCGMLTHEKEYCPSLEAKNRLQPQIERQDVFTRVQIPLDKRHHQPKMHQNQASQPRYGNDLIAGRYNNQFSSSRYAFSDMKYEVESNYRGAHTDRIMRRRDDYLRSNRYGGSRVGKGPYDRKPELAWRHKSLGDQKGIICKDLRRSREETTTSNRDIVPYEHSEVSRSGGKQIGEVLRSPKFPATRRLARAIVTPSRVDLPMKKNVTKRAKDATRSLSFNALNDQEPQNGFGKEQIIGALSDMEITDQHDGEMMECDLQDDDLLGLELTEMESAVSRNDTLTALGRLADKASKSRRHASKSSASLGIPSRKFEILRRGSPRKRSTSSHGDAGKSRRHHQSSKKMRGGSSTSDGLMGSKNPSQDHL